MALDIENGNRIRTLREALGYQYRSDFADIFGMTKSRLQALEQGRQRLNIDDFKIIYSKWPWALGFLLGDEALNLPGEYQKPENEIKQPKATTKKIRSDEQLVVSKKELEDVVRKMLQELNEA